MAGVSSTGLGSGIDINSLVSGLVNAESAPALSRLASKEANLQAELSAIGLLKSALASFQTKLSSLADSSDLNSRTVKSSDNTIASFKAENTASVGSYSLEITSLATAQKLVSQNAYSQSEGTLTFSNAGDSFTVTLGEDNNATIQDVRNAINNAEDNFGVTATILNVNGEDRLVFTTNETGAEQSLTIEGTGGSLDNYDYNSGANIPDSEGDVAGFYDQVTAAADAVFKVDGQLMSSASNTVENVIAGATITLVSANPDEPITLTVSKSNSALKNNISAMVESYNSLIDQINSQTNYNPDTQTAATLFGDSLVNGLERQIRNILTRPVSIEGTELTSLAALGITTDRDGKLSIDASKLDTALEDEYDTVATLFSDSDIGIASRLDDLLDNYLDFDGSFNSRTDSINDKLSDIDNQRELLDARMVKLEARLYSQYNAMDALVYSLNQTGNWLETTLSTLPGVYSKKD